MICKNCGKDVQPRMSQKQLLITIVLLILAVFPGVIYLILCNKTTCPVCGKDVYNKSSDSIPANEPKPEKSTNAAKVREEK